MREGHQSFEYGQVNPTGQETEEQLAKIKAANEKIKAANIKNEPSVDSGATAEYLAAVKEDPNFRKNLDKATEAADDAAEQFRKSSGL